MIAAKIAARMLGLVFVAAVPLVGCATLDRREARSTEQLLAAAGFRAKPADTPERIANIRAMPPRELVLEEKGGTTVYAYADPDGCGCLYVGGPDAYSAYQQLSIQKAIANERAQAAIASDLWGPRW